MFSIQFSPHDKLPKYICQGCISILDVAHEFKLKCECSHQKFLRLLQVSIHEETSSPGHQYASNRNDCDDVEQVFLPRLHLDDDDEGNGREANEQITSEFIGLHIKQEIITDDEPSNLNIDKIIDRDYDNPQAIQIEFDMDKFIKTEHREYESVTGSDSDDNDNVDAQKLKKIAEPTIKLSTTTATPVLYECKICPWTKYKSKQNLAYHMHKKHGVPMVTKRVPCKYCDKTYSDSTSLSRHNRKIHLGRPLRISTVVCEYCGKAFTCASNKRRHISLVHCGEKLFDCKMCDRKFGQADALLKHIGSHEKGTVRGERGVRRPCDECSQTFATSQKLAAHKRSHLRANQREQHPKKIEKKQNQQRVALLSAEDRIRNHMAYQKSRTPCEICGKLILTVLRTTHMRMHNNVRPHKCAYCEMDFITSSARTAHMRVHTNVRPFKCDLCDKSYRQSSHLGAHKLRHSGERAFKCSFCTKTFALPFNRKLHERVHTGETPYTCNLCEEKFSNSGALRKHASTYHPGQEDAAVTVKPRHFYGALQKNDDGEYMAVKK